MVNPLSTNPVREIFLNKKLIVLSIAAAMAGPLAAQAAVEVYGEARASLDFVNNNDNNSANKDSTVSLTSNHSRQGFNGDEDLGNGLTALWQLAQDVEFATGARLIAPPPPRSIRFTVLVAITMPSSVR